MTDNWLVLKDVLPANKFINLYDIIDPTQNNEWIVNNRSDKGGKLSWGREMHSYLLPFYDVGIYIKYKIKKKIKHNLSLMRIYVNGQTSNQDSEFHIDMDTEYYYTFILFSNLEWNVQYGGNFNFYNPKEKEYHSITYIPNNGVLIPSNWDHYGSAPSCKTDELRTTIAFTYAVSEQIEKETSTDAIKYFKYYGLNNEF